MVGITFNLPSMVSSISVNRSFRGAKGRVSPAPQNNLT